MLRAVEVAVCVRKGMMNTYLLCEERGQAALLQDGWMGGNGWVVGKAKMMMKSTSRCFSHEQEGTSTGGVLGPYAVH